MCEFVKGEIKVDDFSKPMGRSKSKMYHKIKLLTGKSPNTFIRVYRLAEALKFKPKLPAFELNVIVSNFNSEYLCEKCF